MRTITWMMSIILFGVLFFGAMPGIVGYIYSINEKGQPFFIIPPGHPVPDTYMIWASILFGVYASFHTFFGKNAFATYSFLGKSGYVISKFFWVLAILLFVFVGILIVKYGSENNGWWLILLYVFSYMLSKFLTRKVLLLFGYTCEEHPGAAPAVTDKE